MAEDEGRTDPSEGGDGSEDDDNPPAGDAWKSPTREEWDTVQAALKKANREAKQRRTELDTLKQAGEKPDEKALREAAAAATKEADGRWKPRYVAAAAKDALRDAGLRGNPERLLRLIDHAAVEVDDEGTVAGLDAQVAALKKDYPEFFGRPTSRDIDGGDRGGRGDGKTKMTSAQRLAAQLLGTNR